MGFANYGSHQQKQRTFQVGEEKIQIKSKNTTRHGNHQGFSVWINGEKFEMHMFLDRQEAEDKAYVQWLKTKDWVKFFKVEPTVDKMGCKVWALSRVDGKPITQNGATTITYDYSPNGRSLAIKRAKEFYKHLQ